MVMADISGRDRGQRRTRFPRKDQDFEQNHVGESSPKYYSVLNKPKRFMGPPFDNFVSRPQPERDVLPVKTPVILTKPQTVSAGVIGEETVAKVENHLLKTQSGKGATVSDNNHVRPSRPVIQTNDGYNFHQQTHLHGSADDKTNGGPRLVLPADMTQSVKVVDEQVWIDSGIDWLLDQPDFLVIGVIGMQGVGKSTILSHLAGTGISQPYRSFVFKPQNKDAFRNGSHMTYGIDMFVTEERTILLDSQTMVSPSMLDALIYQEKKCPLEYSQVENAVEIQSLKIASFMFTVCHVVVVVVDWFIDPNLFSFLRMAEMLKPLISNSTASDGSASLDSKEYFPHVVFVLNKASDSDFRPNLRKDMCMVLGNQMTDSKLRFKGMPEANKIPLLPSANRTVKTSGLKDSVNFFMLPRKPEKKSAAVKYKGEEDQLIGYVGHPGFEELLMNLNRRLLSVPRQLPTPAALSEKTWFHYACRVWEFIKRSQMVSDYNRLLS